MHCSSVVHSGLALFGLVATLAFSTTASAQGDPDFVLSLSSESAIEGGTATVVSSLSFVGSDNLAGWSYGVCHDDTRLNPLSAALGATALTIDGGSPPAFVQINVIQNGDEGLGFDPGVNIGLVISFLGDNPLPPGSDYEILEIDYELGDAGLAAVSYCGTTQGAADPVDVVLTVEGGTGSIVPTTANGEVEILAGSPLYTLRVTDASGAPGSEQSVNLLLDIDSSALELAGWAYSVCHDASLVDVVSATGGATVATLNGGAGPDFEQINVIMNGDEPAGTEPGISVGLVISFIGLNPLSAGTDYDILEIGYLLQGPIGSSAEIATCNDVQGGTGTVETAVTGVGGSGSAIPLQLGGTISIIDVAITFDRGDCSADGSADIADAMLIAEYLFNFGGTPTCLDACDTNDDGILDLADPIYLASAVTAMGPPVPGPSGSCGEDPTADGLDCADFGACP